MKGTKEEKIKRAKNHIKSLEKRKQIWDSRTVKSVDAPRMLNREIRWWKRFIKRLKVQPDG